MQGAAFGLLHPFAVPLLLDRGLGPAGIGLVLGIASLASLLAYPAWGAIADGPLGRPRTIALAGGIAALGGAWLIVAGDDPASLTLALSTASVGVMAWGPLSDALTLGELGDRRDEYGRIRSWASIGWSIAAIGGGLVWSAAGAGPVLMAFVVSSLALATFVLLSAGAPDPRRVTSGRPPRRHSPRGWLPLLLAPALLGFMLGLLVTALGEQTAWRYLGLRILDQGGGVVLVGLAAALPAIIEVPVFASSRRLVSRLGLRRLFVLGALLAAGLTLLMAVAQEPWMATALGTVAGAPYALRYMAMVMIIGLLVPGHMYAVGQSLAWLVYAGIAPIVADIAGGAIYEVLGAEALFVAASAALIAGGTIVYTVLSGAAFAARERRSIPSAEVVATSVPPPTPP
jgi:PPP family 3-phenylpropionic acid transporter